MDWLITTFDVIAAVVIFCGAGAVFLLPVAVGFGWRDARRRSGVRRTPVLRCAQLTPGGPLPARALVTGALTPDARGPLVSPLTDTTCVWYEANVLSYERGSDSSSSQALVWESRSTAPVWLDDGTGRVALHPSVLAHAVVGEDDAPLAEQVLHEYTDVGERGRLTDLVRRHRLPTYADRPGRDTTGFTVTELVIRAQSPVTALGRPVTDGRVAWLDRPRVGPYGAAAHDVATVRARAADDASFSLGLLRWSLIAMVAAAVFAVLRRVVHG